MNLYATTTSERASKGQGGKWLDIEIRNVKKRLLSTITVREKDRESATIGIFTAPDVRVDTQKGAQARCELCHDELYGLIQVHHHTEKCVYCGYDMIATQPHNCRKEKGKQQKGDS